MNMKNREKETLKGFEKFLMTLQYSEVLSQMSNDQLVGEIFEHIYGDLKMGVEECIISEVIDRLKEDA